MPQLPENCRQFAWTGPGSPEGPPHEPPENPPRIMLVLTPGPFLCSSTVARNNPPISGYTYTLAITLTLLRLHLHSLFVFELISKKLHLHFLLFSSYECNPRAPKGTQDVNSSLSLSLKIRRESASGKCQGRRNRAFGKLCLCPLPKRRGFDRHSENDKLACLMSKTRALVVRPWKRTKMTKMAGITRWQPVKI